jgi:hypothetical protein
VIKKSRKNGPEKGPRKRIEPVIGIDPGLAGAIVLTDGAELVEVRRMPLTFSRKEIHYQILRDDLVRRFDVKNHLVYLERAIPMAMGSKAAFTYGMGFERIIRAVHEAGGECVLIEPSKWTKVMHEGLSKDLKPKAKSLAAAKAYFPELIGELPRGPRSGGLLDGPVDALLIAGYALKLRGDLGAPSFPSAVAEATTVRKGRKKKVDVECPHCLSDTVDPETGECTRMACTGDFM